MRYGFVTPRYWVGAVNERPKEWETCMRHSRRWMAAVTLVGMGAILLAACSSSGTSSPTTNANSTASVKTGGTATMALDEDLAGFNINTSASNEFVLQEIMNLVWPQA